jgi:hypothetical protein
MKSDSGTLGMTNPQKPKASVAREETVHKFSNKKRTKLATGALGMV